MLTVPSSLKSSQVMLECEVIAKLPIVSGQLVVVVGAGASGEAAAKLLYAAGMRVRLIDRKSENVSDDFKIFVQEHNKIEQRIEIQCGAHHPAHFAGASLVVSSPGVPLRILYPLMEEAVHLPEHIDLQTGEALGTIPLIGEMELGALCLQGEPVLAVTGSSGKTTTVSLAAAMLEAAGKKVFLGGNIGTPLSAYIMERTITGRADVVVLEVSSFQLQGCKSLHPKVGVLLNITPNHLDVHTDMQEYTDAKFRLFSLQTADDVAIMPEELHAEFERRGCRGTFVPYAASGRFTKIRLAGEHNAANAEAAFLACREFGVSEEIAAKAVADFMPLEHRLEYTGSIDGVSYINDSKCTTVDSLRVALCGFDTPVILLAGGKFKGGDLIALRPLLKERVKAVVLFGASREVFSEAWQDVVPISWHPSLDLAFAEAQSLAFSGDTVLLSPATASYDLYANYKERGAHFCRLVQEAFELASATSNFTTVPMAEFSLVESKVSAKNGSAL